MDECKECDVKDARIVELTEEIDMLEDRIKHLEKVIDDQVFNARQALDALAAEL